VGNARPLLLCDEHVRQLGGVGGKVHTYPPWRRLVRSGRSPILERDQGSGLHRILPNAFVALGPLLNLRDIMPRRHVRAMDYSIQEVKPKRVALHLRRLHCHHLPSERTCSRVGDTLIRSTNCGKRSDEVPINETDPVGYVRIGCIQSL
jgi:hypothetical protein